MVVTDLFHIDLNGRKQMSALTKHLNMLAVSEHHIQSTLALQESISQWAAELENDLSFATVHNEQLDISAFLKILGMKFDDNTVSLAETICSLIKICAGFLNIRLLILTGLHSVLEEDSLNDIYKTAMYEKISIMDIERYVPVNRLPCEKYYIIDRDMCEIYNDSDQ